ncbi:MAG: hypothetical protein V3S41_02430 [Spirochaetia bacterium]
MAETAKRTTPPARPRMVTSSSGVTAWASLDDLMPRIHTFEVDRADEQIDEPLLALLHRYSPDAYTLVRRAMELPPAIMIGGTEVCASGSEDSEPFYRFITATDWQDQLLDLLVAVHEEDHGYTGCYGALWLSRRYDDTRDMMILYEDGTGAATPSLDTYYLDRRASITVQVPYSNVPAARIASAIPRPLRTDRFRSYILGTNSTQGQGIFGLLDEYNAYYWTQRVEYDLFDYFRAEMPQNAETWARYIGWHTSYNSAWAEFRLWILTYLLTVEEDYPEYFRALLANDRFREAFTEIDDRYTDLQARMIRRLIDELPAHLEDQGIEIRFEAAANYIGFTGEEIADFAIRFDRISGSPYFLVLHEHMRLTGVIALPQYQEIAERIRTRPAPPLPPYEFEIVETPGEPFRKSRLVVLAP